MDIGTSRSKFNLRSQIETLSLSARGQATVEYLLLIAFALVLATGFMVQFNGGVRDYVEELFSGYSACLLETGELPNLGAQGTSNICQPPKFSWTPSPKAIGNGSAGGKNSSNSPGSENEKTSNEKRNEPTASANQTRNSENGVRGYGGQVSSSLGLKGPRSLNDRPEKIKVKPSDGSGSSAGSEVFTFEASGEKYSRFRIVKINTKIKSRQVRTEKEEERNRPSARSVEVSDNRSRSSKIRVKPRERKPAAQAEDVELQELTFGTSLKWLIIIGLLIAVLLFLGQQVMSYIKSRDT